MQKINLEGKVFVKLCKLFAKEIVYSTIIGVILYFIINYLTINSDTIIIAVIFPTLTLSYLTHEYLHLCVLRKNGFKEVIFYKNIFRFSIYFCKPKNRKIIFKIAISGPIFNFLLGLTILFIFNKLQLSQLNLLGYIFCFHILFLLPFFADGKLLVQSLKGGD